MLSSNKKKSLSSQSHTHKSSHKCSSHYVIIVYSWYDEVYVLTISTLEFSMYSQTVSIYSYININECYFQREKLNKLSYYIQE